MTEMEPNYNALRTPELRALMKDCGLRGYSKLRNADLISLIRSQDASTRTSTKGVAQKQFDPEESDNDDEVYLPFDAPTITKKRHRNNSIQKNRIMKTKCIFLSMIQ